MNINPEEQIREYLDEMLQENPELFLVDYAFKPGNNIKIYLDGDNGITIENCSRINRALRRRIEDAGFFPEGDFSIEVSSPGVDQPLKLNRQYKKNIGRTVEVVLLDGSRKEGKLTQVSDEELVLEEKEGSGKKAVTKQTNISLNQIKHTKVLVTF
jgi:ribosome maturation factor RimP